MHTSTRKDTKRQIEAYVTALQLDPKDAMAWAYKGNTYSYMKAYEDAIIAYEKALQIAPEDELAWINKGNAHSHLKQYENAIKAYEKALQLNQKDENVWISKGNVYYHLKKYEKAIEAYNKAIQINPKCEDVWTNKGNVYSHMKKFEESSEAYNKALKINPENVAAHLNYANTLRENKKFSEAETEVTLVLQMNPSNSFALGALGDILSDEGYFEKAIEKYEKALLSSEDMHPSSVSEIYNNMGRAYGELEDYEKAEIYFQKALSEDEYNVKATRNTRMLEKMKEDPNKNKQYMLAGLPLALISGSYYLLLIEKISQTVIWNSINHISCIVLRYLPIPENEQFKWTWV
ncbi:tetratricopeptide repeat protein [Methanococcoides methylutens]|uniref:tetratricopeptide repeat protein n=1 Tax=Methanococcoides methylutens TaxID=2226 RepID=UPI004044429F